MADVANKLVAELSSLTVLEAAELCKMLEEKWGVSAAAPVAVAAAAPGAAAPAAEEKTEFDVVLASVDQSVKIAVIKEVRVIDPKLDLKQAKEIVESAPKVVKAAVSKEEAQKIKEQLEKVGAKAELK
ncbi:50S ribosomal protein L7/L12 [Haematospirillum sp. 15-248]|uniref:50S ribosomal protein L7/L12 n=1 Tax=Haematospirillum sp. 15-248 TaxID=2723107 RepID=UPI00143C0815|nr:50S ribosomal protein L7/L12 [Haematospirillum sp. 15-248]NKD88447.1 50S ribosomal protein L7/L12 [Haematospirillum sp. 15-248]